jgi:hypothetical protein
MSVQQRKRISFSAVQPIAVRSAAIPENDGRLLAFPGVTERLAHEKKKAHLWRAWR